MPARKNHRKAANDTATGVAQAAQAVTAAEAVRVVKRGQRVFFQGGHATSEVLLQALCERASELEGVEIMHLHSEAAAPHLEAGLRKHIRHNALFTGPNAREAVNAGRADYTPVFLSDAPDLIRHGRLHVHVAMVQVSPPDQHGFCTLGTSVDVARAAVDSADIVIAEINAQMPRTHGDAQIPQDRFTHVVYTDHPLPERKTGKESAASAEIGRLVAELIPDRATLQVGIGAVPSAILRSLGRHKDLGIHSELISDELVGLIKAGVITNAAKSVDPGVSVAAFALGTKALFDFLDDNPAVHLRGSDYTNNPAVIKHQDRMVAINSAIEIDLSGQVCAESIGPYLFSGVGGQVDFLRGAALARDGMPIIALPSTARGGSTSRITPMLGPGAAVTTSRSHVHWVVTEYGAVNLHGLSLRERADALISLAHPDFRTELRRWNRRGMAMIFPGFYSVQEPGSAKARTPDVT